MFLERCASATGFCWSVTWSCRYHVHLLIGEPAKGTPSTIQALKQRVSRDLRRKRRCAPTGQMALAFSAGEDGLPHFWQPRFHDFNVHSWGTHNPKNLCALGSGLPAGFPDVVGIASATQPDPDSDPASPAPPAATRMNEDSGCARIRRARRAACPCPAGPAGGKAAVARPRAET